jgi:hypothetical protein
VRLDQCFEWSVRETPNVEFARQGERVIDHAGAWDQVVRMTAAIQGAGLGPGDRFGYLSINSRGENSYPREVEDTRLAHPDVADAAASGVPDDRWGESVVTVVVRRRDSAVTEATLIEYCRSRIAGYKVPRQVVFADTLPRTATGKVLRRELREPYWKGRARRVG